MGGGTILRGINRVIGVGSSATGRVGAGATINSPSQKVKISSSSDAPSLTMIDDWELAGDEGGFQTHRHAPLDHRHHLRDRLIFGSAPTQQEVLEATSDLQDALKQTIAPVSGVFSHEKTSSLFLSGHDKANSVEGSDIQETEGKSFRYEKASLFLSVHDKADSVKGSDIQETEGKSFDHEKASSLFLSVHDKADSVEGSDIQEPEGKSYESSIDQVETELDQDNDKLMQHSGHSNVLNAFHLLQSNPAIQGMVVSLASDEAVWDAMQRNEKVQEFRQSLLKGEADKSDPNKDADKRNPFVEVIESMKLKVIEYMEKITEVCNQFFGFVDKTFLKKDGEFVDAIRASFVLCIAVLLVVLVKRA